MLFQESAEALFISEADELYGVMLRRLTLCPLIPFRANCFNRVARVGPPQFFPRLRQTMGGGAFIPLPCRRRVLLHSMAVLIEHPEVELRLGDALFSRFCEPEQRGAVILLNAAPGGMHHPQAVLSLSMPLFRRQLKQLGRLGAVFRHFRSAAKIQQRQIKLGVRQSAVGG